MTNREDTSGCNDWVGRQSRIFARRKPKPPRALLLAAATAGLVVSALAALLDWFAWPGELLSALGWRLTAACLLLAALEHKYRTLRAITLAAAVVSLTPTLFLTPRALRAATLEGPTFRLLIANLGASDTEPTLLFDALVRTDADVLILIEPSSSVARALRPEGELARQYPHVARTRPQRGSHAWLLIASRLPLGAAPDAGPGLRAAILTVEDRPIALVAAHLLSPRTPQRARTARLQSDQIIQLVRSAFTPDIPLVLAGDLNAVPTSHISRQLAAETGTARAKPRFRPMGTWPAWLPAPLAFPIDDALVSPGLAVASWSTVVIPGSDHDGVQIDLIVTDK